MQSRLWLCRGALCATLLFTASMELDAQSAENRRTTRNREASARSAGSRSEERASRFARSDRGDKRGDRSRSLSSSRVSVKVASGKDRWQEIASPSGLIKPMAASKRLPVDIAFHFPHAKTGEQAVITLLNDGVIALPSKKNQSARKAKGSRKAKGQDKSPDRAAPANVIATRVGPNKTIRLTYHFGNGLHNQKIEAKVGLARAILNLHLHDGSGDH